MSEEKTVAQALMEYAEAHYEDGYIWSHIVECYEMSELEERVEGQTLAQALKEFRMVGSVLEDRIADAKNSAF